MGTRQTCRKRYDEPIRKRSEADASGKDADDKTRALKKLWLTCGLASLVCAFLAAPVAAEEEATLAEYKAAFMYHFIDFVQWPEEDSTASFKLGILGRSEVAKSLKGIAKKKSIGNRTLEVESYSAIEDIGDCHLLFITSRYADRLDEIRGALGNRNVLTVSDTPGLAREGVAINLTLVEDQLKFEINRSSLESAGLQASAQLLKLAILVEDTDPR
jgi:hypothetical protein